MQDDIKVVITIPKVQIENMTVNSTLPFVRLGITEA